MTKEDLRYRSAEIGYSMAFGAKRHFSTYGMLEKIPSYFGFITTALGIYFLKYKNEAISDFFSVITIIMGLGVVYLNFYSSSDKEKYIESGKKINGYYNEVRSIYDKLVNADSQMVAIFEKDLNLIYSNFQRDSIHNQVFGSGVFAHYKLFLESRRQSSWFIKELKLSIWKDMIPETIKLFIYIVVLCLAVLGIGWFVCTNLDLNFMFTCLNRGK